MHFKLAFTFSRFAYKYGPKIAHFQNKQACAMFLGTALRDQRALIENADRGTFMTVYESVERLLEIKALTLWTAKKFDISTSEKSQTEILRNIVDACNEEGLGAGRDIERTLSWADDFFARPEVRKIFDEARVEIALPKSPWELPKTVKSMGQLITQEAQRVHQILKIAKNKPGNDNTPKPR